MPIAQYLRDKDIIFVLDSDLHLLPLALEELRINGGKSVSLLSSSRDLFADESASAFSDVPVIVASPDYGASIRTSSNSYQTSSDVVASLNISRSRSLVGMDWEPLPASKKEGDALHSILGGKYLFGSNATKKAVLDNINSPSILHIATHAYYAAEEALGSREGMRNIATDSLLRAGVVLAGANISENRADSYLTALEVSGLNLSGTNLVTLSACDTALGNILGSEGVFGLQRALSVAGSRSTLLSLWKVDDNSTSDFMKRFYSNCSRYSKYDALTEVREGFACILCLLGGILIIGLHSAFLEILGQYLSLIEFNIVLTDLANILVAFVLKGQFLMALMTGPNQRRERSGLRSLSVDPATIADMDLPLELAQVEEAFIGAGLL